MTLILFGAPRTLPVSAVCLLLAAAALALCALALLLYAVVSRGEGHGRRRTIAACALLTFFVFAAFWPFFPAGAAWPRALSLDPGRAPGILLGDCILLALLGGAAFAAAAAGATRAVWGGAIGAAAAMLGLAGNRLLFIGDALRSIGYPASGALLVYGTPFMFAVLLAGFVAAALRVKGYGLRRFAVCALVLCGWLGAAALLEGYMRAVWDLGRPSLSAAAGVPDAGSARTVGVVILADAKGAPGRQYREFLMAAGGVDVSREASQSLERYLAHQGYQTVHLAQALTALRRGATLRWEAEEVLDASMIRVDPGFPPDTPAFLEGITVARATTENYGRLEKMGNYAWYDRIPDVKTAQKTFEGFSTAYARFGELDNSNLWLDRIRGLWPLYEDNIHVEPLQTDHDGGIAGSLTIDGEPARDLKVGLFAIPSTTTVLDASRHLVGSTFPDPEGRFEFTRLLPGSYYIALQGEPSVIGDDGLVFHGAPGEIRLTALEMSTVLAPISIERGPPARSGFTGLPASFPGSPPEAGG